MKSISELNVIRGGGFKSIEPAIKTAKMIQNQTSKPAGVLEKDGRFFVGSGRDLINMSKPGTGFKRI